MAWASKLGRARISKRNPRAAAACDRCGFIYNHVNLKWQFDWRGSTLQNLRFLVCNRCYDTPQEQLRAIVVPADPTPIINARVEPYSVDETDYRTASAPTVYDPITGIPIPPAVNIVTQDGNNTTTQVIGNPNGLEQGAVMPLVGTVTYGAKIPALSVISNGTTTVSVTCSSAHGLSNNSQVSIEGLSTNNADGFYSVTVTSATAFTYSTYSAIPSGSILTNTTNIITALVGLPYNYAQIPQTGP